MPEAWEEVAWILTAFAELSASRPIGFGSIGFIPIVEVAAWADANGVEDVAMLIRHVRALDAVYVDHWTEKQKRDAKTRRAHGSEQDQSAGHA